MENLGLYVTFANEKEAAWGALRTALVMVVNGLGRLTESRGTRESLLASRRPDLDLERDEAGLRGWFRPPDLLESNLNRKATAGERDWIIDSSPR